MVPVAATYRLQFHRGFTIRDALDLVPYLADLGVTHIYASPLLAAQKGSSHGYDVCDPTRLNPEIGTEAEFTALIEALRKRDMGLVLDIVPNHMSASPENPWWWDVLAHGRSSRFAPFFDIDWEMPDRRGRGKVILPILGDELEAVLARRELQLREEPRGFVARYFDHPLPLSPESVRSLGAQPQGAFTKLNADPEALRRVLEQQHYCLVFWRDGDRILNYRRFFSITGLAGARVEEPDVFKATHSRIFEWSRAGFLDGLRVDHPDGLYDPETYLRDVRAESPAAWIVIEKILTNSETLPDRWPIQGTTGYDFVNRLGGLFVDSAAEPALTRFYSEFTGEGRDFETVALEKKRLVLKELFRAETGRLLRLLESTAAGNHESFEQPRLLEALAELAACFTVYRTYIQAEAKLASETDRHYIDQALLRARSNRPELGPALEFIAKVLALQKAGSAASEFVMGFQQLTGPAMAKGVEDTAFYCFNRFVMLNEVGGNPGKFGLTPTAFHKSCEDALRDWPLSMLASSTHDTKRSEDVRARLALLSEIPEEWISAVRRWSGMLEKHRSGSFPDRNVEYLFYQTLVGAWPLPVERAMAYMQKAVREAKDHTSWSDPNSDYENSLERFVTGALADGGFRADLEAFVTPLVEPGHVNSLAQTLIKLTAPGVPDTYQGTELWDLSLVDPDNRRAVDFGLRRQLLQDVQELTAEVVWQRRAEGLPKLWVTWRTLALRAQRPEAYGPKGTYEPLRAEGEEAQSVVGFVRNGEVASIVPRLPLGVRAGWTNTVLNLPVGLWTNEFTGEIIRGSRISVSELFAGFPIALVSRADD